MKNEDTRLSLSLVVRLTRFCNLACSYCIADSSPAASRDVLDPVVFERWVDALAQLPWADLSITLHGGEPLVVDPPAELYARIVHNVARRHGVEIGVGLETNGTRLGPARAKRLAAAGVRVGVSIDGPASVHDRHRRNAGGGPSHAAAMRGADAIREVQGAVKGIAVVTEPEDVESITSFYLEHDFAGFRMNPVFGVGRGSLFSLARSPRGRGEALAKAMLAAAKQIALRNERDPGRFVSEGGIVSLARVAKADGEGPSSFGWAFALNEDGTLWDHPFASDPDGNLGAEPSLDRLLHGLGLDRIPETATALAAHLRRRSEQRFGTCPGCPTPALCRSHYGHARRPGLGPNTEPTCAWRTELSRLLRRWQSEEPERAQHLLPPGERAPLPAQAPAEPIGHAETMHPRVRDLVADLVRGDRPHVRDYARWVGTFRELRGVDDRPFVQLAVVARELGRTGQTELAQSVLDLARLGVTRSRAATRTAASNKTSGEAVVSP